MVALERGARIGEALGIARYNGLTVNGIAVRPDGTVIVLVDRVIATVEKAR